MQVGELQSVLDLLVMFFTDWQMGALTILLLFAAIADCRSHRIPNQLVLLGISFAMFDQCVRWPVLEGPLFVIGGVLVGFGLFFRCTCCVRWVLATSSSLRWSVRFWGLQTPFGSHSPP